MAVSLFSLNILNRLIFIIKLKAFYTEYDLTNFRIGFAQSINSKSRITNETFYPPSTTDQTSATTGTTTHTTTKPGNLINIELVLKSLFEFFYLIIQKLLHILF